ncbi:MAG: pilus assembly protein TadG-related protein [Actinomycetota bacterium]
MTSERGQVTVMVLGLAIMSLAIAGLAVDGTRAFLLRRTLQDAADAASLAGAGEINRVEYYGSGGRDIELAPEEAARRAREFLALRRIAASVSLDVDDDVRLVLRGSSKTLFLALIGVSEVPVAVESNAVPVSGDLPP